MNLELSAYITLACTSGVLNLFLSLYVFFKRHHYTNISYVFILYTFLISIYCFGTAFSLLSTSLEELKFWTTVLYVGLPISAPLGLLFIMQYLGFNIFKKRYLLLLLIPFISLMMVATNDFHHLYYRVYEIDPVLGAPYVYQEIGFWYLIHGIFTFSSMFTAFYLLLSQWRETSSEYRPQLVALLFGQLLPMMTAFIYLIGLTPPGIDPVPMVFWISSMLYLWAIGSSRLFRIMPIAKMTIFNNINDGVIVLDTYGRLIEFNEASEKMFPGLTNKMFGKHIEELWQAFSGKSLPFKIEKEALQKDLQFSGPDHREYTYQLRTKPFQHGLHHKGQLLIFTDITEVKRLQLQLEHLAYYDELTQIYNRRAFFRKCDQYFAEAKDHKLPLTVILMDIDHFKRVNDTYGHAVGDQVLNHMVKVCEEKLEPGQLFGRYGGEEFVLALQNTDLIKGEELAEQLRHYVEDHPFKMEEGVLPITLSLGVSSANHEPDETLFQLLNQADKALYQAKEGGRNRVKAYTNLSDQLKRIEITGG
ncbi:histidine kinase N-terminal 7TM domain-containing diguanylate cyclase [Jeotgalibacillus haloalkalitolerans]|uniref:Diguanylate cyclase n=1 Tax=Jeotgalibacillus haloalkalitolerans TaxID=3104292 RepID=A0ABU5KHP1_9BACL|nr:diguanylate cyclase [Jeotgalibacillus sp. HH7-29]MDZ5710702.1 diguanylate cyclase [Jeotgalibacillus sp. HH7-29]